LLKRNWIHWWNSYSISSHYSLSIIIIVELHYFIFCYLKSLRLIGNENVP
jgi:hypothetical protein